MSLLQDLSNNHGSRPDLDAQWFEAIRDKHLMAYDNEELRGFVNEEVDALRDFYHNPADVNESARRITAPISASPIPSLGTYSDETVALIQLWDMLYRALLDCSSNRTADILALFSAIGQLPDSARIHDGEATDAETGTQPLTWNSFVYFSAVWGRSGPQPGEIVKKARDRDPESDLEPVRQEYIRRKTIEAQLIARGVLSFNHLTVKDVAKTFETRPDSSIPADDSAAFEQNRLDFQVPAVAALVRLCGDRLFHWVVQQGGDEARWIRWEKVLDDVAEGNLDATTKMAAREAHTAMQELRRRT